MSRTDEFAEIKAIADAVSDETVTPEQVQRLDQLLEGNEEAQRFYCQYIEMHVQMQTNAVPDMEVVRRSLQLEEVILRPANRAEQASGNVIQSPSSVNKPAIDSAPSEPESKPPISKWYLLIAGLPLLISVIIITVFFTRYQPTALGEVVDGGLQIEGLGRIDGSYFYPGNYLVIKESQLKMQSGEVISLAKGTEIKFYNAVEVELSQGALAIEQGAGSDLIISGPNFTVHSGGDALTVDLTQTQPQITAGANTLLLPERWRPQHFWSFDSNSDRAVDFAGNATGIPDKGATRVQGLVGNGAFYFDNSTHARINVGSGGGTVPATGSFSVADGVTIEALIAPEYTGETRDGNPFGELDEIFRNDQDDLDHRMLLSFQRDEGKDYLRPKGDFDETLSFGLYLIGQGYHELKLPLDGKQNRPSLADLKDGKPHHIVATYNVSTGLKAIFINGVMQAYYQYPPGSKMLSGGSGMANIGNSPKALDDDREAFSGIIDEMAFYDFALPAYTIKRHFEATKSGFNYFGLMPDASALPAYIDIPLQLGVVYSLDPLTGLPLSKDGLLDY